MNVPIRETVQMNKPSMNRLAVLLCLFGLLTQTVPIFYGTSQEAPTQETPFQTDTSPKETMKISSLGLMQAGNVDFTVGFNVRNSEALTFLLK
jgi:hypothetical protein